MTDDGSLARGIMNGLPISLACYAVLLWLAL